MRTIHKKKFTREDFSCEKMNNGGKSMLDRIIERLNVDRACYVTNPSENKQRWDNIIQLLPSSYNQRRTIMMNYEVLTNIYKSRRGHKLSEWKDFCDWIDGLSYSELITGEKEKV